MPPLHDAVISADTDTVLQLIREGGVDLGSLDRCGSTPLCYAISLKHTPVHLVALLLESGANASKPRTQLDGEADDSSPLIIAAERGWWSVVELLLAHGADVNYRRSRRSGLTDDASALDGAVQSLAWESAGLLVEAGADLSPPSVRFGQPDDVSPLMFAASWGRLGLVGMMLEKGADPNHVATKRRGRNDDRTALHMACLSVVGMSPVRLLIDWGADVTATTNTDPRHTPLHILSIPRPRVVSALVIAGADPFGLDHVGRTAVEILRNPQQRILLDSRPSVL